MKNSLLIALVGGVLLTLALYHSLPVQLDPAFLAYGQTVGTLPTPVLSRIDPPSAPMGSADMTITLSGSGFMSTDNITASRDGASVVLKGSVTSSTTWKVVLPAAFLKTEGSVPITVRNSDGYASNSLAFSVLPARRQGR